MDNLDSRAASILLTVTLLSLVLLGLGTSVVASFLRFGLVHDAFMSLGTASLLSPASLDTTFANATGGFLDFATFLSIVFVLVEVPWLIWLVRHWN